MVIIMIEISIRRLRIKCRGTTRQDEKRLTGGGELKRPIGTRCLDRGCVLGRDRGVGLSKSWLADSSPKNNSLLM
jgi:hypothetical protein